MSFQDLWNKFPLIFGLMCDKKTCAFVVMRIGKKVENSINFSVCSLHFVPGLQAAFCTDRIGISVFVRASLETGLILTAIIDMWTACWRAHEEKYSNAQLRGHSVCVLKRTRYGSPRRKHFGFSTQVAFSEVRKCDLGLLSLLNHLEILILSTWVSELHRN